VNYLVAKFRNKVICNCKWQAKIKNKVKVNINAALFMIGGCIMTATPLSLSL